MKECNKRKVQKKVYVGGVYDYHNQVHDPISLTDRDSDRNRNQKCNCNGACICVGSHDQIIFESVNEASGSEENVKQREKLADNNPGEVSGGSVNTSNTLNKGFCENISINKYLYYAQSPVKCDVSIENLMPTRLRSESGSTKEKETFPAAVDLSEVRRQLVKQNAVNTTDQEESKQEDCNQATSQSGESMDRDIKFKCPAPIVADDFENSTQQEKMGTVLSTINSLCLKLAEVDIQVNHDTDGLVSRFNTAQVQQDGTTKKVTAMEKENKILRGLVQRQFCQINELNNKVAVLSAKAMENTLTITSIEGDSWKENTKEKVLKFLKEKVEIEAEADEILVAHRLGKFWKDQKRPRLIKIRVVPALRERVMENVSNLKEKTNSTGAKYYVNKQLPEQIMEQNRANRKAIQEIKDREENLPSKEKTKIVVKNKQVFLNGEPMKKELPTPEPLELFPESPEKDKLDKVRLTASDVLSESGSDFQAYAVKAGQIAEARRAYRKVKSLHPASTHVIGVFRIKNKEAFQDDGEHSAGHRVLKAIQEKSWNNIAIFVIRNYGGIQLGPKRHELINQVAIQAGERIMK